MMKKTKEMLEQRKHILEQRTEKENYNIVKKIERQIRKLKINKKEDY